MERQTIFFQSPLGQVRVSGSEAGVSIISCVDVPTELPAQEPANKPIPTPVTEAVRQLQEYFEGKRQVFDFQMQPEGTDFQQSVWRALLEVPFGKTESYLALSRRMGDEKAIRAVAAANGRNPLWIVVPCHRIIGSDGSLTGYAGGLWRKKWLLEHEGAFAKSGQLSLF